MFGAYFDESSRDPARQAHRFDRIAGRYDLVNDVASWGFSRQWTRAFAHAVVESVVESIDERPGLAHPRPLDDCADGVDSSEGRADDGRNGRSLPLEGLSILDVACGTGTSSRALAQLGANVIGCDISEGMIAKARQCETAHDVVAARAGGARGSVVYCVGDASDLGFADNRFDAVTCCYGLRNMPSPVEALRQMVSNAYRLYDAVVLPLVGGLLTGHPSDYRYLTQTIEQWPGRRGVAHMMRVAGLRHPQCKPLTMGIASLNRAWK